MTEQQSDFLAILDRDPAMVANQRYLRKKRKADKFLAQQRSAELRRKFEEQQRVIQAFHDKRGRERAMRQQTRSVLERMIWNLDVAIADKRDDLWALEQVVRAQLGESAPPMTKKVMQSEPSQIQKDLWAFALKRRMI